MAVINRARASPSPNQTLDQERTARFTARPCSALMASTIYETETSLRHSNNKGEFKQQLRQLQEHRQLKSDVILNLRRISQELTLVNQF